MEFSRYTRLEFTPALRDGKCRLRSEASAGQGAFGWNVFGFSGFTQV
jgi:hypothetical protein